MKQTKQILYSLLMAIVMIAMSPMRAWAQEADPRMAVFTELNGVTATFKDGNYPWEKTEHEGFDALTSTNQGENETTSETTIKLNCEQCIMLSFNYAVSCEDEFDLLTIVVDGETVVEGISGTESGVYEKLLDANGNGHTITMRYTKDDSAEDNDDCGYIYNIMAVADAHQHQFNDNYVCTLCGFRSRLAVFTKLEGVTATFEDEGDYPWGLTMYNGLDALMSTNQGKDGTTSKTTIKLACDQAIDLQFSYKTSSEGIADYLIISVDGKEVVNSQYAERGEDGITTVVGGYASLLPANAKGHTITISYIKDDSSSGGDDCGYIYFISAYTHQHYYNTTSCDWSEDNTSATLHLECECGETADVEATTITRTEEAPTCEKDGFCTITASSAYNGKTVTYSKTETFAALGHDWQVQSDGTYACQREGCTTQSATFPIEVIESSGGFESEGPEKLFDGDPNTKWCGYDVENESNSFYVIFKPDKPSVLVSYSLVDAEDTQKYNNRGWSSWDIQGTNDPNLALWESISSENGDYQGSTFTTGNTTAYTYYMITFSVVRSEDLNGENYLQQMADMNITWCTKHQWGEDHKCSVCGYECQHSWDDGVCELCGYECQHQDWEYGECTICGYECKHKDSDEDDYCDICGIHAQTFASLAALIAAGQDYDAVNVTIDEEILMAMPHPDSDFSGMYLVALKSGVQLVAPIPEPALNWQPGGTIKGTVKYADWGEIDNLLTSKDASFWSNLTYTPGVAKEYNSIEELLAADLENGTPVTVTVNGTITETPRYLDDAKAYQIVLDNGFVLGALEVAADPGWVVGGTISGTLENVTFMKNDEAEEVVVGIMSLNRNIFTELNYTAPAVTIGGQEIEIALNSQGKYETTTPIALTDDASFTANVDFIAPSVNYTRDLRALTDTNWGTLCVPFELPYNAADGVTFYTLTSATAEAITLSPVTSGSLPAGTPVLFKRGAETSSLGININNSTQVKHSTATGSAGSGLTLTGTYVPTEIADGYYLSIDGLVYSAAEYASEHSGNKVRVGAFRAWFAGSLSNAAKGLILNVDDDATALEAIDALTSGKAEYYDMQGRKLNEMQRGINIVKYGNGKTVKVNIK